MMRLNCAPATNIGHGMLRLAFTAIVTLAGCASTPVPDSSPSPTATPVPTTDDPPSATSKPLLPTESPRVAFQSACGQAVFACSGAEPVPLIEIIPEATQFVTVADGRIVVTGENEDGVETIRLSGSGSVPGTGATNVTYSWSYGAVDDNPDSFVPGTEFSTEADPVVRMGEGFHYVRLIVRNGTDSALENWSPTDTQDDFLEMEIEIRISRSDFFAHRRP